MGDTVIKVENIWKEYRLGTVSHRSMAKDLQSWWARVRGKEDPNVRIGSSNSSRAPAVSRGEDRFWALRDVSFEVKRGEILGIIGRNGAGKSTLLKILSNVTTPTQGQVTYKGRIASLLEVGTGFHPELTGRENIFLNGAILGMGKKEIRRKFEEIVGFAEIDKFIDTPVKRYSSGMYVRLAFGVAAHLEPEILIIDEVLAVGDAAFQKKCLGKMGDVTKEGRTVLFVSHNMQALQSLCLSAILLDQGEIVFVGDPDQVVAKYLRGLGGETATSWADSDGLGDADIALVGLKVSSHGAEVSAGSLRSSDDIVVTLEVRINKVRPGLCIGFDLIGRDNVTLMRSYDTDSNTAGFRALSPGISRRCCIIPRGLLNAGHYALAPRIGIHNQYWILNGESLVEFDVILDHGQSPYWNALDSNNRPGLIAPILQWVF